MRVGIGYDIHRLGPGRTMVIGGVEIEHETGPIGHSDADALIHAIIDAVLGAAGLGDIGELFPPSDPQYEGISSRALLRKVASILRRTGRRIVNIDAVVILERPRIGRLRTEMAHAISSDLRLDGTEQVNIKATTKEKQDATGQEKAVEAYAVALLDWDDDPASTLDDPYDEAWV